jgi:FG-GAP repeat
MRIQGPLTACFAGAFIVAASLPLGTPVQQAKLLGSDTAVGDKFGYAVAVSGLTAVVGATYHNVGRGSAYVFVRSASTWVQQGELVGGDSAKGDSLGQAVAISGSEVLVGAPDHAGGGAAYFFHRTGTTWSQQFELFGDHIGAAVGISGGVAVVGAVNPETSDGAAYVYTYINGNWIRRATLRSNVAHDAFGQSVAIAGDELAVGANGDGEKAGHVYVYRWTGTTAVLQSKLIPAGTTFRTMFGESLALSGSSLVVGAPTGGNGASYVYSLHGGVWRRQAKLLASDGHTGDGFGWSVGLSGNVSIVGADAHAGSGTAYIFTRVSTKWSQTGEVVGSNTAPTDAFGAAVAQSGADSVVGAPNKDDSRGQAYVFVG